MTRKSPWEKEWESLLKAEARFTAKRKDGPTSTLLQKLDRVIPKKFSEAINKAFFKGFQLVFEKGTSVIEKTYNKKQQQADFKVEAFASVIHENRKTVRMFNKKAKAHKAGNLIISFVEGVGLGIFGLAIVDIPIFVAMVLKSVYQVALSFGYEYDTEEEKIFILRVIQVAMCDEEDFVDGDNEINEAIEYIVRNGDYIPGWSISKEEQTKETSDALVREMLYTKAIEKIPVAGVLGGIFDPVYINRITNYAVLKYRRRFIRSKNILG